MEVSPLFLSEYKATFNGLRKSKSNAEKTNTESQTESASSNSGKILRNYVEGGLFSRAKLHFNKIFGNNINNPIVLQINELEDSISKLTDDELKNKTLEFKEILSKRKTSEDKITDIMLEKEALDSILPEAFAVVRETSKRVLGKRPRDVQLLAGIAIHNSQIAEMMTGEGKTLAAVLPAYLNALTNKGVHILTTNDYLAKRDSEQMGKIYSALGMTVGVLTAENKDPESKRAAYNADITYGTSGSFGFDYMTDNMTKSLDDKVQRPYNFAIIDEADSILIDEATTPLIICGLADKPDKLCNKMADVASMLVEGEDNDYEADETESTITLTEKGMSKAEEILGVDDLYNSDPRYAYYLLRALKAKEFFIKNRDYVVKNGEIILVDEYTGRPLEGRKWADGLHQAVQAKENLNVESENQTIASITIQNFLKLYPRISGMTGTAATEKEELNTIYNLKVNEIPTNLELTSSDRQKTKRDDQPDRIYKTEEEKNNAVIDEIIKVHNQGRPILVGTTSVESSENLSRILRKNGIKHTVLNAKNEEKEANIIAQAGRYGAVTIATNMAGRGTDIELGGNAEYLAKEELKKKNITPENDENYEEIYQATLKRYKDEIKDEKAKVLKLGGLHVIGTEKHDARRIDNQLKGRASRQGDPGSTVFFVSLEDKLIRNMGGEELSSILESLNVEDNMQIKSKKVEKFIAQCQRRAESKNFRARKSTNDYDNIINLHRQKVYEQRNKVLSSNNISNEISGMIEKEIGRMIDRYISSSVKHENYNKEDLTSLIKELHILIPQLQNLSIEDIQYLDYKNIYEKIKNQAIDAYKTQRKSVRNEETFNKLEKYLLLKSVDSHWTDYLYQIDMLREGVGLAAIGGKDPLEEFRNESFKLFEMNMDGIQGEVVKNIFSIKETTPTPQKRMSRLKTFYDLQKQNNLRKAV